MKKQRLFLFLFLLLCGKSFFYAQTYNFRNYTEDEGLPQSYVYCISQSDKGFLYLSTGEGFSVFDGNKFKTFTNKDSLTENFVNTHYVDSKGTIWFGHFQSGISYLKNSKIYKLKGSEKLENKVLNFSEDKEKNIWFVVQQKGLFKIDTNLKLTTKQTPVTANFNQVYIDKDNDFLCATDEGLFVLRLNDQKKLVKVCTVQGLEDKNVKYIVPADGSGMAFWVAVPGEGVFKVQKSGNYYQIYNRISTVLNSSTLNISNIFSDKSGNLWIGLFGEGVRKVSFADKKSNGAFSVSQINKQNGLSNEYIQSIFQDFEGNMWFGTFGGGLIEMPINKFGYYSTKDGLAQDNIKAIIIDSKTDNIWLGNDKGLNLFKLGSNNESIQYNSKNGFVDDQVNALLQDSTGLVWIGTAEHGIYTFNLSTNKFENFSKQQNLKSLSVNTILQTKKGTLIFGTTEGAYFYNPKTYSINLITTIEGLLHNNVFNLFEDKKRRTWFSSHGAVPYYLKNDEFTVLKDVPDMRSFNVNAVTEDNNGLIWLATEGDGVFSYNGNEFKNYKVDEGLLSNFCYFITCDKNNSIWVGHKNGLSKKPIRDKNFIQYTKADGLIFTENNLNASFRDVKGNVWFGTSTGVVKFDCDANQLNSHEPRTSILGLTLNNFSFTPNQINDTLKAIQLSYGHYEAKIDFVGISLVDPSKVLYKYRLLGHDSVWRTTTNRSVEFPKLSDGNYVFQLVACNNDGVWNLKPVEIKFEIALPLWKKDWFYVLASIFLVGLIYLIIAWRTKSLVKASELLTQMVEEKTVLLKEEKEVVEKIKVQLEEKNKDITDSINYAKRIQEALLPSKESILEKFPEAFILFKPKDIVSGDFYWFAEVADYYIIAAIDCTGHGVPGAFMSLIASTLLKEIVLGRGVIVPSQILQNLNNDIIEVLKQNEGENSSRDGMDMSICRIDKQRNKMIFAGAARPLYFMRNGVLIETKGQGYPIGGHYGLMNLSYSDTEVELQKGDVFYIFSDGYADQFREGDRKKFTTKRLKLFLTEICGDGMKEQHEKLNDAFETWKGASDQIDDILIIGIKI